MRYRAFIDDEDEVYRLEYYHNPKRWTMNMVSDENPIKNVSNWSHEIKYLNELNNDISDEIKTLPNTTGGIYIFYLKGLNLPFIENYILYIGRCQYADQQNIRKRAKEYYSDKRALISRMFHKWDKYLYYRYYPDVDNDRIKQNEVQLIRSILPYFNEDIPDNIEVRETIPAFE